jgi:uncharacterized protein YdaU (DUF1376 family)
MEPAGGSGCGVNYFELYPGDYLKATQRLTLLEHGAYLRLLMAYYGEEEPLPADLGELFVTVSAISAADKAAVKKVADRFFPVAADGLRHNDRADAEIEKAQRRIAAAKANGSKGGRKPKANPNPAETQRVSQWATQPLTQSGEALHAPHATTETEDSVATPPPAAGPADRVGQFECHDHPEATPNPVAPFAIALNSLGFRCTSMTPDLVAYQRAGGTVEHLTECAGLPDCTGKPAAYAIRIARRELTERAPTITGVTHESARVRGNGRRLSAVEQVEHAIAERQQREAAAGRTFDA